MLLMSLSNKFCFYAVISKQETCTQNLGIAQSTKIKFSDVSESRHKCCNYRRQGTDICPQFANRYLDGNLGLSKVGTDFRKSAAIVEDRPQSLKVAAIVESRLQSSKVADGRQRKSWIGA